MKILNFKKNINPKLILEKNSFKLDDFIDPPSKFTPGEWFLVKGLDHKKREIHFLGSANPYYSKGLDLKISGQIELNDFNSLERQDDLSWKYIQNKLKMAHAEKNIYKFFENGGRMIHGNLDGLHGLVVDLYQNCALIQINSAGMEVYREKIKKEVEKITAKSAFFIDNTEARKNECLPQNNSPIAIDELRVLENGFCYLVPILKMQKTGYYYDHRVNRSKMESVIRSLNKNINCGLDLFCYVGSWTMHALRSGVPSMTCVDQSEVGETIAKNIKNNNLSGDTIFFKDDVFKFLEKCVDNKKYFDLIICDPPGFSKKEAQKKEALAGYRKLYNKIFKILMPQSILVVASCSQQISMVELDEMINEIALTLEKKISIMEVGLQSPDHTFSRLSGKSTYIKCLIYKVL